MEYLYQLYISYRIPYRTPREASYRLPIEYLMTYEICSGFIKGTLTSWALGFSHITRPLNGLGFMEGILQCWAQYFSNQSSYGIGFCLSSYPGIGFAPCSTLNFSYKPLTKWVGRYEGNSPVMGSTSSSQSSIDSIDVLRGRKETPARNRSFHFLSQLYIYCIFTVHFFPYAWCFSLSSI